MSSVPEHSCTPELIIPDPSDDPELAGDWLTYFDRVILPDLTARYEADVEALRYVKRRPADTRPPLERPNRVAIGGLGRMVAVAEGLWPGSNRESLAAVAVKITDAAFEHAWWNEGRVEPSDVCSTLGLDEKTVATWFLVSAVADVCLLGGRDSRDPEVIHPRLHWSAPEAEAGS